MHLKISSVKRRPFCPGWDELKPGFCLQASMLICPSNYPVYSDLPILIHLCGNGIKSIGLDSRPVNPVLVKCSWAQPNSTYDPDKLNSSPPGQNGRHFADDIFRRVFVNEKLCTLIKISLNFVPRDPIDNNTALVQVMAWRRRGDKPLPEPVLT